MNVDILQFRIAYDMADGQAFAYALVADSEGNLLCYRMETSTPLMVQSFENFAAATIRSGEPVDLSEVTAIFPFVNGTA